MYPKMKIQKRGPLRSVPVARIVPVSRKARFREAYSAKLVSPKAPDEYQEQPVCRHEDEEAF